MKNKPVITLLIIAIIALLAVYYFLGMDYLRQRQDNEALTANITGATLTLSQTPRPPQDLAQRLATAEAGLAAAQSAFPRDLNSTQIIDSILKLADACQVKAIPMSTKPWSKESTGQGYYVFRLNLAVRGSFSQVTSFVSQMENGELESLVVEKFSVTRATGATAGEITPVSASLDLAVYTQLTTSK